MNHQRILPILLLLAPVLACCARPLAPGIEPLPLSVIGGGQQMVDATVAPGAGWVTDQAQLAEWLAGRGIVTTDAEALPEVDFTVDGILAIWMGQRRTGGFSLELAADTAVVDGRVARVPVRWIEPEEGMLTPQVITHPYLLVRLPLGDYDSIAVVDERGKVRLRPGE